MTTLVILPGLDGSPHLQGDLSAALQTMPALAALNHQTLLYPRQALSYLELADWARAQLPPDDDLVLLGESFGGPLALLLAGCGLGTAHKEPHQRLRGVVLAASFAHGAVPWAEPLAPLLQRMPARALLALPGSWWSWWLLGRWATPDKRAAIERALRYSPPAVLQHRALQALRPPALDLRMLPVPLLALSAAQDRLIAPSARQALLRAPHCQLQTVPGPHMLLQTQAEHCAPLVAAFVQRVASLA